MGTVMGTVDSMKNKREKGTGSVFQRADGMWVGSIEVGWTSAGRRRKIRVYAKTKKAVLVKMKDRQREIALNGIPAETVQRGKTVKTYAEAWLENRRPRISQSAYATDRSTINQWIIPTIGHVKLENLGSLHIYAVHKAMKKAGRAQSSILRADSTMRKMFKTASAEGMLIPAGVFNAEPPKKGKSTREAVDLEDAKKILIASEQLPNVSRWAVAFLLAMRPAEARGLTWSHVDFERNVLHVSWQLKQLRLADKGVPGVYFIPDGEEAIPLYCGYHLVRPKTVAGERVLPLIEPVRSLLLAWRDIAPVSKTDLVWTRPNGLPLTDKEDRQAWKDLCALANVKEYDLYSARHTTASLLREMGVPEEVIEMIMGHASFSSTQAYIHPKVEQARVALEGVAGRLIEG